MTRRWKMFLYPALPGAMWLVGSLYGSIKDFRVEGLLVDLVYLLSLAMSWRSSKIYWFSICMSLYVILDGLFPILFLGLKAQPFYYLMLIAACLTLIIGLVFPPAFPRKNELAQTSE